MLTLASSFWKFFCARGGVETHFRRIMTDRYLTTVLKEAEHVAEQHDQVLRTTDNQAHEYLRYTVLRVVEGEAEHLSADWTPIDGVQLATGARMLCSIVGAPAKNSGRLSLRTVAEQATFAIGWSSTRTQSQKTISSPARSSPSTNRWTSRFSRKVVDTRSSPHPAIGTKSTSSTNRVPVRTVSSAHQKVAASLCVASITRSNGAVSPRPDGRLPSA